VAVCQECGAGNTLPAAGAAELESYYPAGYGPYELPDSGLARLASRAIRAYQAWRALRAPPLASIAQLGRGRLVDVGSGRGDLAALFAQRGWHASGVEPSADARAVASARGVDARGPTLAEASLEPGVYDAAVFQHSLEHLADPVGDLELVRAALRPGGLVAITVPNFSCWQRVRFGSRWFHLDLPRHRVHFGPTALRTALERAGLEELQLRTASSSIGLPGTIQYALFGRCLFPEGLRLRVAAGLAALTYPLALLLDRLGRGGDLLHAVARRPVQGG
jgi:SAM-dependent methyltransferase